MEMYLKDSHQKIIGEVVCKFETEDGTNFIVLTNHRNSEGLYNLGAYYYENISNILYLTPIKDEDRYLVDEALEELKKGS